MDEIGTRLKSLRQQRGLSQRKLARLAGVSNATVSLIEHGRTDPSMGLLRRILESLDVSFADFFALTPAGDDRYFYVRRDLVEIGKGLISYRQVGGDLADSQLQILHEVYKPGADTGQSMLSHEAEEGGVIIQGRLEVTINNRVQILSSGDAYRFNSRLPHRFRNLDKEDCIVVSACTPPSF